MQTPTLSPTETITLAPSYLLPLGFAGLALPAVFLSQWVAGGILALALFLAIQAASLRLCFTPTALCLRRGDTQLREFPYSEWLNWQIYWSPVPILFYFREVKSIHFVPILFDPVMLQTCLASRCPRHNTPQTPV